MSNEGSGAGGSSQKTPKLSEIYKGRRKEEASVAHWYWLSVPGDHGSHLDGGEKNFLFHF